MDMSRWSRSGTVLILAALLGACSMIEMPPRVTTVVALVEVQHRIDGAPQAAGQLQPGTPSEESRFTYSDAWIEAEFTVHSEFIELKLHNRSSDDLAIAWERSQFVGRQNIGVPLVSAGELTFISGRRSPDPKVVPAGSTVMMRLAQYVGDTSRFGVTRPLFNVDRGDKARAESSARGLLGTDIRIILALTQGNAPHEYSFRFRLDEVRLDGEAVSP